MVEVETIVNILTLVVVVVVFTFVSIAYYRTRIPRLLVLLLLTGLLGGNMVVALSEDFLESGVPGIEIITSLFSLGIAVLLLVTIIRRFSFDYNE